MTFEKKTKLVVILCFVLFIGVIAYMLLKPKDILYCDNDNIETHVELAKVSDSRDPEIDVLKGLISNTSLFKSCKNYSLNRDGKLNSFRTYNLSFECEGIMFNKVFYITHQSNTVKDIVYDFGGCGVAQPVSRKDYPSSMSLDKQIILEKQSKNYNSCMEVVKNEKFNLFKLNESDCKKEFIVREK